MISVVNEYFGHYKVCSDIRLLPDIYSQII